MTRRRRSGLERTIADARRVTWRASSVLGDVEAVASGSPAKVARRFLLTKPLWKALGRLVRGS